MIDRRFYLLVCVMVMGGLITAILTLQFASLPPKHADEIQTRIVIEIFHYYTVQTVQPYAGGKYIELVKVDTDHYPESMYGGCDAYDGSDDNGHRCVIVSDYNTFLDNVGY